MSDGPIRQMSLARQATLACLLEVSAPKPGNVHRGADFEDMNLNDFLIAATLLGDAIDSVLATPPVSGGVGQIVLNAVSAARGSLGKNPNLGICLLLAPLVVAAHQKQGEQLRRGDVEQILDQLDENDSRYIYDAIRVAAPGGLGKAAEADVTGDAPADLVAAMKLAADRDLVAAQYANGYVQVFEDAFGLLIEGLELFSDINEAIVFTHLGLMSRFPDSLIARKNGIEVAEQSAALASRAFDLLNDGDSFADDQFQSRLAELDFWLRSDGHKRNPGTTADLIAATLFVVIHNGDYAIIPGS